MLVGISSTGIEVSDGGSLSQRNVLSTPVIRADTSFVAVSVSDRGSQPPEASITEKDEFTAHAGMVCFGDDGSCNCKLQKSSGWTCYVNKDFTKCYDENSDSEKNIELAEECEKGKTKKRYEKV